MATTSVSSEEDGFGDEDRVIGSYSVSADVSESESSCCTNGEGSNGGGLSSLTSSPVVMAKAVKVKLNGDFGFVGQTPVMLPVIGNGNGNVCVGDVVVWEEGKSEKRESDDVSEVEMMKERFAKLLLGEDMSGGGKGVCTALAISNAITNLSASVFGELWRLEPLAAQKKSMWCREMEWLLSISDSIVELVPKIQDFPGGGTFEVMVARPRSDLYVNLPALKKLDAMLLSMLDGFHDTDFWYVDRGIVLADEHGVDDEGYPMSTSSCGRPSVRQEEKWWLPCPRVPNNGLSEDVRKRLQQCRDCANQILKAAMAINSSVLAEMEIPEAYLETLPKCGKACLGDIIYRYITADQFSPECLLDCLDLSSEHHTLEIANRIEAALHVWGRMERKKRLKKGKTGRSWGGKVKDLVGDAEKKSKVLAERAESLFHSLRLRYPCLPQTALDMTKIQYNKDVGQSILESYSRVMESLAFNIMARIDDLIYVDDATRRCLEAEDSLSLFSRGGLGGFPIQKRIAPSPFSINHTPYASPFATPTFCSSTPITGSPRRVHPSNKSDISSIHDGKKMCNAEKMWSYAGNLSSRRNIGDAAEHD